MSEEKGEASSIKGEAPRIAYRIEPSESSLNFPPPDDATAPERRRTAGPASESPAEISNKSSPLARTRKLAGMFDPPVLKAWFNNAYFREGPPVTLVLRTRAKCAWVRDRFGDRLRRAFGDDLEFTFEREREVPSE